MTVRNFLWAIAAVIVALLLWGLITGDIAVRAGHPKPDPQPSHGQDCDNGNPTGGNRDHCGTPKPDKTHKPC